MTAVPTTDVPQPADGEPVPDQRGDGILTGINVVELAQNAAIPHCGRLLAGMGADVVKVEPPGGDAMRSLAALTPTEGRGYALINPGKRAIVLDLGHPGAAGVIDALFGWADVALVAFKQGDLKRYGIDWDHASAVNERLVYLAHTAFGPEGPDAHVGGYDVLVQARSGAGFVMNRAEHGVPSATRPAVNDFGTGMVSALGVVAALRHRDVTGRGQRVDSSLLGTAMALATPMIGGFEADAEAVAELRSDIDAARAAGVGFADQRRLYEERVTPGAGAFRLYFRTYLTLDGMISVAGLSAALQDKFHRVTGLARPGTQDPSSDAFRSVVDAAESLFRTRTTAEWLTALREVEFPCGPYNLPYEALDDDQIRANDYVVDLEHSEFGRYTTSGMPLRFSDAGSPVLGASPRYGEHTREVLAGIGFDAAEIDHLVAAGTVEEHPTPTRPA
ncbi:CaiB/BaiF CoA transferase family protein [Candidatus Poriferisodalis sp.]|uniref:CaiB/BaiF CoA transferase family protein n=1 Tax=Candidatus Poriferisodalis sp. TaxID=3101277 RepID=UPI003B024828